MAYQVLFKASIEAELAAIPEQDRLRIIEDIEALATQPRPSTSKKLKGQTRPPVYRIRTGRYRTLYTIEDDRLIVLVIRVGARKDVYRNR